MAWLAALVLALTGSPTPAHCGSVPVGVEGFTVISGATPVDITIGPAACRRLRNPDPVRAADGWYVLAHEAVHAMHPTMAHEDPLFEPLTYWNLKQLLCLSGRSYGFRHTVMVYNAGPSWDGRCDPVRPLGYPGP